MIETGAKDGRKRILAVDDAATILLRITDTLEKYYDVITVNSGVRALRYLERVKPDLILLDIRMTPKNGFETLREIRDMKDRADIPVIMLTAMEDKNSVLEGLVQNPLQLLPGHGGIHTPAPSPLCPNWGPCFCPSPSSTRRMRLSRSSGAKGFKI